MQMTVYELNPAINCLALCSNNIEALEGNRARNSTLATIPTKAWEPPLLEICASTPNCCAQPPFIQKYRLPPPSLHPQPPFTSLRSALRTHALQPLRSLPEVTPATSLPYPSSFPEITPQVTPGLTSNIDSNLRSFSSSTKKGSLVRSQRRTDLSWPPVTCTHHTAKAQDWAHSRKRVSKTEQERTKQAHRVCRAERVCRLRERKQACGVQQNCAKSNNLHSERECSSGAELCSDGVQNGARRVHRPEAAVMVSLGNPLHARYS